MNLYLEFCFLWIRNMGTRKKWRKGHKCVWNMELERNVKSKMDRYNNERWSFSKGQRRKTNLKNLDNRRHSWIGHTIRYNGFVANILEGAISGKKAVGSPRLQYLKQVDRNTATGSYIALKRMACNSSRWKAANQSKDWMIKRRRRRCENNPTFLRGMQKVRFDNKQSDKTEEYGDLL